MEPTTRGSSENISGKNPRVEARQAHKELQTKDGLKAIHHVTKSLRQQAASNLKAQKFIKTHPEEKDGLASKYAPTDSTSIHDLEKPDGTNKTRARIAKRRVESRKENNSTDQNTAPNPMPQGTEGA